jgi:iron complex transport system substrate-binding protein
MCEYDKLNSKEENKISVYIEIELGGPVSFGAHSYITDALFFLGFNNIFSHIPTEWLIPDDKSVCQANPQVIIYEPKMFSKKRERDTIVKMLTQRFGDIDAIKYNNIFITPGIYDFLAHHGPYFIREVLPWLLEIRRKFT